MISSLLNFTPLAIKKDSNIDLNIGSDINMSKKYIEVCRFNIDTDMKVIKV